MRKLACDRRYSTAHRLFAMALAFSLLRKCLLLLLLKSSQGVGAAWGQDRGVGSARVGHGAHYHGTAHAPASWAGAVVWWAQLSSAAALCRAEAPSLRVRSEDGAALGQRTAPLPLEDAVAERRAGRANPRREAMLGRTCCPGPRADDKCGRKRRGGEECL